MGKAAITRATTKPKTAPPPPNSAQMKTKKKKGRPSFADLQKRQLNSLSPAPKLDISTTSRRSSRRRSSGGYNSVSSEFISDDFDDEDDDDDEREEKKVKLVVRLPESTTTQQLHSGNSSSQNSGSGSDSEPEEGEDHDGSLAVESRSNDDVIDQGKQDLKVTNSQHGSPMEGGPTPLPEKKLLLLILDRLQKKDTHGVFAEPVDPEELPDYHEIVEQPMDFGTVRKKLDSRGYSNLEELEADIYLICSNAMLYNATHTVYHRQARAIAELAKRDFANLRNGGDDGEPKVIRRGRPPSKNGGDDDGEPKVIRRGRPPSKNIKRPTENSPADRTMIKNVKKLIENSPVDRTGFAQLSSGGGATLASGEDNTPYNLRKGPALNRFRNNDGFTANNSGSRNGGDNYSDWLVDWNSEFPAKILRADMKYGKKDIPVDEYRRDTYKQNHQLLASANQQPYLSNTSGDRKQLIAVGLHLDSHGYARSIARYAANLGPVAWKVASMKIKSVLTDGTPFGPGWVGENDLPSQTPFFASSCEKQKPINGFIIDDHRDSCKKPVSTVPCLSSNNIASKPLEEMPEPEPITPAQQQKSVFHHGKNGYNGVLRHDSPSSQTGSIMSRIATTIEEGSASQQTPGGVLSKIDVSPPIINSGPFLHQASSSSSMQQRPVSIPPDLNVRIPASNSPSSMKIGSPQQPDLVLQL